MTMPLQETLLNVPLVPAETVLESLPLTLCLIDPEGVIRKTYGQAELFFGISESLLLGRRLREVWFSEAELLPMIEEARKKGVAFTTYDIHVRTRSGGKAAVAHVSFLNEYPGWIVLTLDERSATRALAEQTIRHDSSRSMTALALTLAHEIKNPLSGIRGAAQLLEQGVSEEDRTLTSLICTEADRIVSLVNRMEVFSDERPLEKEEINIHYILDHVRKIAENGFARHVKIIENYDPSLPPVWGNRDALIQIFLNLIKNAAEAVPETGGTIVLGTAYYREMKLFVADEQGQMRAHVPIVVSVSDNGRTGIPDELKPNLFDLFVTTKASGGGLGLPLVAKIIRSHGGMVEFTSRPGETVFRVLLPLVLAGPVSNNTQRRDSKAER